jgi:sugar lactone lactonase YvrE
VIVGLPPKARAAWKDKPKLIRWIVAPAVALCLLTAVGASAATLASNSAAPATTGAASAKTAATDGAVGANAASATTSTAVPSGTLSIDGGTISVQAGTSLTFDYSTATANVNATNWVGVYQQGQTPGDVAAAVWGYTPDASGQVTLSTTSLAPGAYEAWLLYDNGYGEMSGPVTFTVTASGTISVSGNTSVVQGLPISFAYTATPANAENWIGLYHEGDSTLTDYLTYTYTPDASGTASIGTADLPPGTYQAYLLYDNGYTALAGPVSFTVTAAPVVPQPVYHATIDGTGKSSLNSPSGIAVDSAGNVWTTDSAKNDVAEFAASGRAIKTFGGGGSGNGQFNDPEAIAVSGSDVYVADSGNNRVEEFTTGGQFVATIGGPGTGNGQFTDPEGVAVDSAGDVYVSDTAGNRVEEFSQDGSFMKAITAGMSNPQGLAIDAADDLWVAQNGMYDTSEDSVIEYSPAGTEIVSLGAGNNSNYAGMSNPSDVAIDSQGNVYVTEPDYDLVQEFNVDSLYEGEFGTPGSNGTAAKNQAGTLYLPSAVAAGSDGQVYVADTGNHRLTEFVPQVAPKVAVQPVPVTVFAGFPAIFHAAASGTPQPTVQWESAAPGATTFTPITGATIDTLVVPGTKTGESGTRYEAVFTNATGTATTTPAALTVQSLPTPHTPPNHPGGPGSPSWKTWPSAPSWGDIFAWPGVPAWPGSPAGRPAVPAKP